MKRPRLLLAFSALLGAALVSPLTAGPLSTAEASTDKVAESNSHIVLSGDTYTLSIEKEGFRYEIVHDDGRIVMGAHAESGLAVTGESGQTAHASETDLVSNSRASVAVMNVRMSDGRKMRVIAEPKSSWVRFTAHPLDDMTSTIDFRTASVAPSYGLGDYGAHANGQPDEGTPCGGRVEARPAAELTGTVLTNLTNEGSCKRFVSNFVVFPAQGAGQVLFDDGPKRVALTASENSLGVADTHRVDGLYYFVGDMPSVYRDYKAARETEGYADAKPRQRLFELGWEAYGALAWNTYQEAVENTIGEFLAHGYPLRFGIVGSGFWPGARGTSTEGSTTSFGMWDDTCDYDPADGSAPSLPCPRYPDVDGMKTFFEDNELALILGLRNNMKAPDQHDGWNPHYDGDFAATALEQDYFLRDGNGHMVTVTSALFPRGPQYVLDADQPAAVDWFVHQAGRWGADGFKEDASFHEPNVYRDDIWNALDLALHDAGYDVIVRNAAYSVPGDVLRVNDTYYGTGETYSQDPDRVPVNMLNFAASGAPNVYTDYVGGTPTAGRMDDPSYQLYFTRNAQLLAVSPAMSFGRGPWEMDDPDVEGDLGEVFYSIVDALYAAFDLPGVALELLAEADRCGVHEVGPPRLDDVVELPGLPLQRALEPLQGLGGSQSASRALLQRDHDFVVPVRAGGEVSVEHQRQATRVSQDADPVSTQGGDCVRVVGGAERSRPGVQVLAVDPHHAFPFSAVSAVGAARAVGFGTRQPSRLPKRDGQRAMVGCAPACAGRGHRPAALPRQTGHTGVERSG
jgi:hypothetical protein